MTTVNQQDAQEIDVIADDLVAMFAGLELLNRAADTVVDFDDTMREFIRTVILTGDLTPSGADVGIGSFAQVATLAALAALAETDEDDLEDPITGWIRKCPRITGLSGLAINPALNCTEDLYWFAIELQLPGGRGRTGARLNFDDDNDVAMLIVTGQFEIVARWVTCPTIIKKVYSEAESY